MTAAGEAVFEAGKDDRSHYSYEAAPRELAPDEIARFKADAKAWADWEGRPPSYRRVALHWVTSAKKPETRAPAARHADRGQRAGPQDRGLGARERAPELAERRAHGAATKCLRVTLQTTWRIPSAARMRRRAPIRVRPP
jgi:hypothetical protein